MKTTKWLVEVCVKDWVYLPEGVCKTLAYEEVEAISEVNARYVAFDKFAARAKYEPKLKKLLASMSLTERDYCTPEAIQI